MIQSYLIVSILLFCIGIVGVISRRNVFTVFMSIELMLNAANLAFVTFARLHQTMDGHVLALIVMAVAAAEGVPGIFRRIADIDPPVKPEE